MEASDAQEKTDQALADERRGGSGKGAKAYRTLHDVTFPRVVSRIRGEGEDAEYAVEGVNYPTGSVIHAETMTPRDRKRVESGELDHLLEPVSDEMAEAYGQHETEPEFGVFIAEHEAEAYALEQYGHQVIPKEQEMELLSSDAEHARKYQEDVRKSGMDRRPHLEALHPRHRERVANEAFLGAEQRTGAPHYRGEESGDDEEEGGQRTRQAPPQGEGQ